MNQFGITHDWPGLCALCHTEVAEFNGSHPNGIPIIARWKANKGEVLVVLDNGSKMRVTVCSKCESTFKPEQAGKLMESVRGGWQKECEMLVADDSKPEWDEAKKSSHMKEYSKLAVVDRIDSIWSEEEKAKVVQSNRKELR